MIKYTQKELTEKKWSINDVCKAALAIIKDKTNGQLFSICVDKLKGIPDNEMFAIERLNKLTEDVIDDTFYYDGYKVRS